MLINLSESEISALINTALDWCDSMQYERSYALVLLNERLENGLGSALCKLHKGKVRQKSYKKYKIFQYQESEDKK